MFQWLEPMAPELRYANRWSYCAKFSLRAVSAEGGQVEPVKEHATGVVRNPHDPEAQWSAKGKDKQKKTWVGYKAQIAESFPEKDALNQERFITSIVTQKATESDDPGLRSNLPRSSAQRLGSSNRTLRGWSLRVGRTTARA